MYDALIIGSGIGSLTTAGLLAQTAGLRVLVLEKHSTPGGLTHSFRAMGASWDVGLHYVGDMEPGRAHASCWTTSPAEPCHGRACRRATTVSTCPATAST